MKSSKRFLCLTAAILVVFSPTASHAQWTEAAQGELVIFGGWIFDSVSGERYRNSRMVVRDGKIAEMGTHVARQSPDTAMVIELQDSDTILPGLIDLHAHYNFDLVDKGRVEEVVYNGIIFLANGVTATWSAGEFYPERVLAQRDLIDAGTAVGPRLFASGPYFGAFRYEYSIKIKQATPGEANILIDQAHKNGMTTTGHLTNYNVEYDVHPRDAIRMGLDRLEQRVFYGANMQMYGGINLRRQHPSEMVWTDEAKYFTPYAQELLKKRGRRRRSLTRPNSHSESLN